jgi:hypothetical protein
LTIEINQSVPSELLPLFTTAYTSLSTGIFSFISFLGGRHLITELYSKRQDIFCNPIVKIIILFSIIYINFKNIYLSIILFFLYVIFIENYILKCKEKQTV